MYRGVNRNIIEINQTDNQYFEKVILFVRQSHKEKDITELETHAKAYIKDMSEEIKPSAAPSSAVGTKQRVDLKALLIKAAAVLAVVAAAGLVVFL